MAEKQAALSIDERVAQSKGKELFRPISDFLTEEKSTVVLRQPTPAQVEAWRQAHPGGRPLEKLKLIIGFPKGIIEVPCMAVIRYDDHVLMLNVDGSTHRFNEGDFEE